jgi:hypothetical protein
LRLLVNLPRAKTNEDEKSSVGTAWVDSQRFAI